MRFSLDEARRRAPEMAALLREVVALESPSTDPAGVASVVERLARELEPLGLAVDRLPVPGGGPLLRARGGSGAGRPILLLGHSDTVWPLGTLAARPIRIEGDRLFGPGAYDMKAGLVVAVEALRLLATRGELPPVAVLFTPLEETDGEPYREVMEDEMRRAAAVLDFEPAWPGGAVKTGRKGSGSFLLRARGIASHAGADLSKGASAILELARQILALSALTDAGSGASVNVGVVRGGIRTNVVPDLAEAEIDVRYTSAEVGRRLEAAFRDLRPTDPRVRFELEGGLHYPPLERNELSLGVYAVAREVAVELGLELDEVVTGGASEAAFASALGIPTLDGLGADGDGAHAEHEHVLLSSLPERVALTAGLVARLAARAPSA